MGSQGTGVSRVVAGREFTDTNGRERDFFVPLEEANDRPVIDAHGAHS